MGVREGGAVFDLRPSGRGCIAFGLTAAALIPIALYLAWELDQIYGSDSPEEAT